MPTQSLAGRLLVASPELVDPNFHRTVIFVLAHTEDGALGLVLNRPSEATVEELVPPWNDLAAPPSMMFLGGPVGLEAVVGLGHASSTSPERGNAFAPLVGSIGTVDLNLSPADMDVELEAVRLFAGSAGWSGGQLEDELDEKSWFVVDIEPADVFTDEPDQLWRTVLRRQPGRLAWFANAAGNPMFN